jgi:hypothetical protein
MKYLAATSIVIFAILCAGAFFFYFPCNAFGVRYSSIPSHDRRPQAAELLFFREYFESAGLSLTGIENMQVSPPTQPNFGRKENEDRVLIEAYRGLNASGFPIRAWVFHSAAAMRYIIIVDAPGRFSPYKALLFRPYWDQFGSQMGRAFTVAVQKI